MLNSSNDVVSCKDVPFGGHKNKSCPNFFFSGNLHFCHPHLFMTIVSTQIYQFCTLHWAKIAFFCLPEVFCDPKYAKMRFRLGLRPDPDGETHNALLDPSVGWGGDTLPIPQPLIAFGARHSCPPRSSLVPLRCFRAGYGPVYRIGSLGTTCI